MTDGLVFGSGWSDDLPHALVEASLEWWKLLWKFLRHYIFGRFKHHLYHLRYCLFGASKILPIIQLLDSGKVASIHLQLPFELYSWEPIMDFILKTSSSKLSALPFFMVEYTLEIACSKVITWTSIASVAFSLAASAFCAAPILHKVDFQCLTPLLWSTIWRCWTVGTLLSWAWF